MGHDLDAVSSEYKPNAPTELENDLILHWYPTRMINRYEHAADLLELGLGHGFTAPIFAPTCDRHVVVEGSPAVISQFRRAAPTFSGEVVEDFFETYTPTRQFDIIIMGFVLEHVDDPGLILRRYRAYLKERGKIYVAVPNAKSLNRRLGLELGLIDDIYSLNANDIALGHQRQFCRETLRQTVVDAGYQVTHEEGIYLKPLPLPFLKNLPDFEANLRAMLQVGIEFPDLCVGLLMELSA